jgi:hypothetical protein
LFKITPMVTETLHHTDTDRHGVEAWPGPDDWKLIDDEAANMHAEQKALEEKKQKRRHFGIAVLSLVPPLVLEALEAAGRVRKHVTTVRRARSGAHTPLREAVTPTAVPDLPGSNVNPLSRPHHFESHDSRAWADTDDGTDWLKH